MPLFMDIHLNSDLNLEEVAKLHEADLRVQGKYGVTYQRYWVNEQMGTVFCLMNGPDKESCIAVHRESHGQIGCNIIEVQPGDYEHYLGQFDLSIKDRAFIHKEKPDTGFRTFVHIDLIASSKNHYSDYIDKFRQHVAKYQGTIIEHSGEGIQCIFTNCSAAIKFAIAVQNEFYTTNHQLSGKVPVGVECHVGISAGDPVEEHHQQFFAGIFLLAKQLCDVAKAGQILVSKVVKEYLLLESKGSLHAHRIRVVDDTQQIFLDNLMKVINENLGRQEFNAQILGRNLGLSRPQLYRKVSSLTGFSPGKFIREQRLKNAASRLRSRSGNISEVAITLGFTNPSYFARCFQERFGLLPSKF